jgi:hypothetical protein
MQHGVSQRILRKYLRAPGEREARSPSPASTPTRTAITLFPTPLPASLLLTTHLTSLAYSPTQPRHAMGTQPHADIEKASVTAEMPTLARTWRHYRILVNNICGLTLIFVGFGLMLYSSIYTSTSKGLSIKPVQWRPLCEQSDIQISKATIFYEGNHGIRHCGCNSSPFQNCKSRLRDRSSGYCKLQSHQHHCRIRQIQN